MKKATPEQKAAKAARHEKFRAMIKQVAAMSEAERAQITARIGAVLTCEGRELSPVNTTLLLMQMPNASLVGGFRQWLKAGRAVCKGQHGAMIWVPVRKAKGKMQNAELPEEEPAENEPAEEGGAIGFVIGTVFDISQTEELTEQAARISQHSNTSSLQSPNSDDMRFDPTNPQKVPAMTPVTAKPRKRGQQIIPPAPPVIVAKAIDLDSVVFEPAPASNIVSADFTPAANMVRLHGPSWRRVVANPV